jgi:2-C-methyl-D-erythritol 4-phosphate cytidylyltransferase
MAKFSVVLLTVPPAGQPAEGPGAFVKIDGRESLLRSVELFLNRDNIGQIQLVVTTEEMEEAKRKFGGHLAFSGVKLIPGGPKWFDQIAAAAEKISPECPHVILHDAARPIVAFSDIDALLDEASKFPVVALCASVRSELAEVDPANKPLAFHSPTKFVQLLYPWSFRKDKFLEMAKTRSEPQTSALSLLRGSPLNMRISNSSDAHMAKALLNMLPKPKIRAADNPFEEAQW